MHDRFMTVSEIVAQVKKIVFSRSSREGIKLVKQPPKTGADDMHKLSLCDRLIVAELLASRVHASIHHRPRPLLPDAPSAMYARQVTAWVCLGSQR